MGKTLAIYGAGGLGRELLELVKQINQKKLQWNDIIFIDDDEGIKDTVINKVKVCPYDDLKKKYSQELDVVLGVGEPAIKEKLLEKVRAEGWHTPSLIHPNVYIPDNTSVGKGVVIHANSFISCNVRIEDDVYIQPHVNIGHDCVLRTGSVVSGLCHLAGGVQIGKYTYLGMSSCYKEFVSVGDYSVVGMGAVVYKDIEDRVVAVGNPARVMRRNEERRVFK